MINPTLLREMLAKATPLPWTYHKSGDHDAILAEGEHGEPHWGTIPVAQECYEDWERHHCEKCFHSMWDFPLIVSAVNSLPALLDEVERLRAALAAAFKQLEAIEDDREFINLSIDVKGHIQLMSILEVVLESTP